MAAQQHNGVAVVGAGIIGCLVARELVARDPAARDPAARDPAARDPGTPVTVFDRDAVGAGASRRSAGLHLPRGSSDRTRRMSAYSHAYYADLKRANPRLPIHPIGATVVTGPDDGLIEHYLPEAAPTPVPKEATKWRITGAHHCDVQQLAQALAAQLRPRVTFAEGVAVTKIEPRDDGVAITTGTGAQLTVGRLILAPGPWLANPAWHHLVKPLGLRVKRVAALHLASRPGPDDEAVLFDAEDAFLLPLAHRGHWLFSYASREWDTDPDRPATGLTATEFTAARDCLRRCSPALAGACQGGRVFCDAYSPDREPVVQRLDPEGRIVFAGAACGSGYRLGPAIAAEAAHLAAEAAHMATEAAHTEGVTGDRQHV